MTKKNESALVFDGTNGTSSYNFKVTGIGEFWRTETSHKENEGIFTKADFEKDLKKVSRKIKK